MSILKTEGIKKRYGFRPVLKGLDFNLEAKEGILLMGKNGAGKTTFMRILSGLIKADEGDVYYFGINGKKAEVSLKKKIGVMFHQAHLYENMTAAENLQFFCSLYNLKVASEKILTTLKEFDLLSSKSLPVKHFSTGMRKRVGLAKLLLQAPELLFLDEPYSGLDQNSIQFFNDFLTDFKSEGGSLIIASHQIEHCLPIVDKVLELKDGGIVDNTDQFFGAETC